MDRVKTKPTNGKPAAGNQVNSAASVMKEHAAAGMDAETDMVLLDHVSFAYDGQHEDIRDVSLAIGRGEWVTLVGANGCGKSTLIRLMNGLLRACGGCIAIGGIRLEAGTLGVIRQKVGMVFQNPDNQFIGATVEEDMAFGLEGLCLSAEEIGSRISRYAVRLGIGGLLPRHPQELSGGQKQRAALAAILAMEPELIILDEASSMLDEKARSDMLELLREMHREERYTLLSITHDAEEIAASQRVLVMEGGRLAADVAPQELFRSADLLRRCRMELPFRLQLAQELEKRGVPPVPDKDSAGAAADPVTEVMRKWAFNWSM
ncbi:ATP-binding cassette domain-containing protein [Paenibacillus sp. SAF-054]|uniref:ATP-binding cassette domain-containing protein n=1 Tax=unclassified Paenibacillus TaxID=185978 RepID=UPI003F7CE20E